MTGWPSWSEAASSVLEGLSTSSQYMEKSNCIIKIFFSRSKFGKGFQIIVKLKSNESKTLEMLNDLKGKVISKFKSCHVTDEHLDYIHFHVPDPSTSWHSLFSAMETVKGEVDWIQDYTVNETTLEQIFLGFAREDKPHQESI